MLIRFNLKGANILIAHPLATDFNLSCIYREEKTTVSYR